MRKDFYLAVQNRRSYYGIGKEKVVSEKKIEEVVKSAVKYTPSAFNSQGARVVVLFGDNHNELWNITKETLKEIVPEEEFAATEEKIASFRNGYGTVLFFIDDDVVKQLQKEYTLYKDNFPVWAQQSNGMLQYVVWTSLELEGLGASLQHYNPLIDDRVKSKWNLPDNWRLIAQMPFGKILATPEDKRFQPVEERVKIFN
ncbi:nitroreductase family protein [Halocella sp. SP3-1]|uniref:nitroreductase family protein n=1 Tax=Halocella sp. SP3-1 TaxID=2382161 RepID=UPI000F76456A|nr:nitroreductase family protein [Halocella sp. SP3-1]AZO93446.1 nitroreductase family protein [Halocella sp. SP3-1]